MDEDENVVVIDGVRALRGTGAALLVECEGEQYWIPYSLIDAESEVQDVGDEGELIIPEWFADKEGIG